jgi:phosphatidylglycerophosphate synthase
VTGRSRSTPRRDIDAAALAQAIAMLIGVTAAVVIAEPRVFAVVAVASFGLRIGCERSIWAVHGRFGPANWLTSGRVVLTAWIGFLAPSHLVPWAGIVMLGVLLLDGFDGPLARRTNTATTFGAAFDQEADAFMVAMAAVASYCSGLVGAWILSVGVLRYLYVLVAELFGPAAQAPRSLWGRAAFTAIVIALAVILLWPNPWTVWLLALATMLLVASFARSFWWSLAAGPR